MKKMTFLSIAIAFTSTAANAEPRTDKLAQELVNVTLPRKQYDEMVSQVAQQITVMLLAQKRSGNVDEATLRRFIRDGMRKVYTHEELKNATAAIMVKYYTDEELRQLVMFYSSPVGKKSVRVMPKTVADSMAWSNHKVQQALPKILAGFEEELKAKAKTAE